MTIRLYGISEDGSIHLIAAAPDAEKLLGFSATLNAWLKDFERASIVDSRPLPADLPIWVVYKHPRDWPDWYVARMFMNEIATGNLIICREIDALRVELCALGLTPLARNPGDDPVILETWL